MNSKGDLTYISRIANTCPFRDQVERVVAFSQYPQYSCTTSGSSFNAIARHYISPTGTFTGVETIAAPSRVSPNAGPIWSFLDRWPVASALVNAFAKHIMDELNAIEDPVERRNTVLLFSAHSIPMSAVERGDPYPQVSRLLDCFFCGQS